MATWKRARDLVGCVVRVVDDLETKHDIFPAGETCIVLGTHRGQFTLTRTAQRGGIVRRVRRWSIELLDQDLDGPFCARCGCSENDPCECGCFWAEDETRPGKDVCSACVGLPDIRR